MIVESSLYGTTMSVRCPEMYRHPFYPPISREELEKRDRLLADFRLSHEEGGSGGSSRSAASSPKVHFSKGCPSSGGLLHPMFDDSADCSSSPRGGRLRVQWTTLDTTKARSKIRRNCLGFTADGGKIIAGFKDSVATVNPASLSVHSSVPAQGVSLVLPHPTDVNLVAVGMQEGASAHPCICLYDLRHPPRSLVSSSSGASPSCIYTSPYSEEWWAGAWHPSGKYFVCADMRDCLHCIEPSSAIPLLSKKPAPRASQQATTVSNSSTAASVAREASLSAEALCRSRVSQLDAITYGCCICHGGRVLVLSQDDGQVRLVPAEESVDLGVERLTLPLVQGPAVVCAASHDGNAFACGGGDGSVHVCSAASASVLASFPKACGAVQCLALSHDGQIAAWACRDRSEPGDRRGDGAGKLPDFRLTLASVQPAELLQLVETHGCVTDLTFHPSKTLLAVACEGDQGAGSSGRYGISAGSSSRQILGLVSLESTM